MKKIFLVLLLTFPIIIYSQDKPQNPYLDSMLRLLPVSKGDTSLVRLLDNIAIEYLRTDPNNTFDIAIKEKNLSQELGFKQGEAYAFNHLGAYYTVKGDFDKAISSDSEALVIEEKIGDKKMQGVTLSNLGKAYEDVGNLNKATDDYFSSKKMLQEVLDTFDETITIMYIGGIYARLGRYTDALNAFNEGLANCKNDSYKKLKGRLYRNIGMVYNNQGDLKQASQFLTDAKVTETESGDNEYLSIILCDLGDLNIRLNNYTDAMQYYTDANNLAKQYGYKYQVAASDIGIGTIYCKQADYVHAERYCMDGSVLAKESGYQELIEGIDTIMIQVYQKTGRYQQALETFLSYDKLKDVLQNKERNSKIGEVKMQEEFANKERSDSLNNAIKERDNKISLQRQTTMSITGGVVAVLLLGFLFFMGRNNKLLGAEKKKVENTLHELKLTQTQLIQSEKMASLGELTAGIAHEIQNPLNFVNNFSELNNELIDEMLVEMDKGNMEEVQFITADLKQNMEKINHHGKRADSIVKGMLQHSRTSQGIKEPADLNALADEYMRLSYHGLRAKDKSFNAKMNMDLDNSIGNINMIPQDMGRVLLNLFNNAFYAVSEKKKANLVEGFEPTVTVSTKKIGNKVEIRVDDNGTGIPQKVVDKIFQPFFTTKPTGEGTGLGLSLSYDIVTKGHGGELKVNTRDGEGTTFIVIIPA